MTDKCSICHHYHKSDNDTKVCTYGICQCDITKFQPELETKSLDYYQSVLKTYADIYDKVEYLLKEIPQFRELTNKEFLFAYWHINFGFAPGMKLEIPVYVKLTDPETVTRCKRKVVENNPTLAAAEKLSNLKNTKEIAIMEWVTQ